MNITAKILFLSILITAGCAHQEPHRPAVNTFTCPRPAIKTLKEAWSKEDESMIPHFNEGCARHFTKDHCPVKILKSKKLSYQVTCKKVR